MSTDTLAKGRQQPSSFEEWTAMERRARRWHTVKQIATLGLAGSQQRATVRRMEKRIAQSDREFEARIAQLRAEEDARMQNPAYRQAKAAAAQERRELEGATYMTSRDGTYAGNLRYAAHNHQATQRNLAKAVEAEVAGNPTLADRYRSYAASTESTAVGQQQDALRNMRGTVEDDGSYLDFGIGQPYYHLGAQETARGMHELALQEDEAWSRDQGVAPARVSVNAQHNFVDDRNVDKA